MDDERADPPGHSEIMPINIETLKALPCPVCGKESDDLRSLNLHLDEKHSFGSDIKSEDHSRLRSSKEVRLGSEFTERRRGISKKPSSFRINNSFWKTTVEGKTKCFKCNKILDGRIGSINCRKCGELFCLKHCKNVIKLNSEAQYDPLNGVWCKCCHNCFCSREGYNDYGYYTDKTLSFLKTRDNKNEDMKLTTLQLESRLVRLINGIYELYAQQKTGFMSFFKLNSSVLELERRIVPWRNDDSSLECSICNHSFGIFQRKHHCRLCGEIVCDMERTCCSSQILVANLVSAAQDLPFSSLVTSYLSLNLDIKIRICSKCLRAVFANRKFKFDTSKALSPLLFEYEQLQRIESSIIALIPQFESCLAKITESSSVDPTELAKLTHFRKNVLQKCSIYDKIYKKILKMEPHLVAEQRIKLSITMRASNFIESQILPLRRIPDVLDPTNDEIPTPKTSDLLFNNLTISEVKKYREELMVVKEQRFLVEEMFTKSTKDRNFEEAATLKNNLEEIDDNIKNLELKLGDQGFD